jgi:hypothetical protein
MNKPTNIILRFFKFKNKNLTKTYIFKGTYNYAKYSEFIQ